MPSVVGKHFQGEWAIYSTSATYFQDWGLRKRFLHTGELAGFTVSSEHSRHYLLADYVPVGEAITLAMRTAVSWY